MSQKGADRLMTSQQIILFCHKKSKENKYFVAPLTILKQFEQEKIAYQLDNNNITVFNKIFRIERG